MDHLILARRPNLVVIDKTKMETTLGPIYRTKKLWNIKMKIIPVVVGVLGMVPKCLEIGLEELETSGRMETI